MNENKSPKQIDALNPSYYCSDLLDDASYVAKESSRFIDRPIHWVYGLYPIDNGWEWLLPRTANMEAAVQFAESLACRVARWDGRHRCPNGTVYVIPKIETSCGSELAGMLWKGDNNGDTFLVSICPIKELIPAVTDADIASQVKIEWGSHANPTP